MEGGRAFKSTGKRSPGRPRRRWEDKVSMNLKAIGVNTRNWIDSAWVSDYSGAINLWVP